MDWRVTLFGPEAPSGDRDDVTRHARLFAVEEQNVGSDFEAKLNAHYQHGMSLRERYLHQSAQHNPQMNNLEYFSHRSNFLEAARKLSSRRSRMLDPIRYNHRC